MSTICPKSCRAQVLGVRGGQGGLRQAPILAQAVTPAERRSSEYAAVKEAFDEHQFWLKL